jgi:hypothetical protein
MIKGTLAPRTVRVLARQRLSMWWAEEQTRSMDEIWFGFPHQPEPSWRRIRPQRGWLRLTLPDGSLLMSPDNQVSKEER